MINSIFKDGLFSNKVVLITGGGTGIGLRTAREFGKLGAHVVIASRKEENLKTGLALLKEDGCSANLVECNIREQESIEACYDKIIADHGTVDILINNGGGQFPSPAEFLNRKGWHAVIETNLTGTFFMAQTAFNKIFNKSGGTIVNILMNNRNGFPMLAHSAAARAGVENLTRTLANEWGKHGVRINSISPGVIDSTGLDKYPPQFREFVRGYGKHNQTYRLGTEAELASAIVFLASPGASFITGVTMAVDGGESNYNPLMPPIDNNKNPKFDDQ